MFLKWQKVKETYYRLLYEHGSPHQLAMAFALGVFVGVSPFLGLHTLMALGFSYLLRLNKPAILLGTMIFNPLFAPFQNHNSVEADHDLALQRN